ncbi:30S ribosomal protein S12 methylthiotransferase RimO [Plantactinospora sp. WMMB334]|uniref:30S ribosomal protein S12 methylthiotransferase RimO n=1 Tax=Plantactinospora sp. WMMB334 TaxID=3404119 RepID=UPI003B9437D6
MSTGVPMSQQRSVSLVTLGCARNETDSEELAARLEAAGWQVSDGGSDASGSAVVVVNTCGFIEAAKQESVTTVLRAAQSGAKIVAAGCMAERYGKELAAALPEASAVLSFDDYPTIADRLDDVLDGREIEAHQPRDRRRLLPLTPAARPHSHDAHVPGHGHRPGPGRGPQPLRKRLAGAAAAPLKLASGCDRRCSFCAIPSFRGAFVSRHPDELVAEAEWLAGEGVRELVLVSENTTSYGKDFGDLAALEKLLPRLAGAVDRIRLHYLQPAELRPSLIAAIASTPGVAPYFDLSFQHASGPILRRMRRFGDRRRFLDLVGQIRDAVPAAGLRSNFIVGFPGESDADFDEVVRFVEEARLDAVGVFGYSDEDGTEAGGFTDKTDPAVIGERVAQLTTLAQTTMARRAAERVGSTVDVIVSAEHEGWAGHQAPEIDGLVRLPSDTLRPGDRCAATVVGSDGVDLVAEVSAASPDRSVPATAGQA